MAVGTCRPRQHLPGIGDIRIAADAATVARSVEVLGRECHITAPEPCDSSYSAGSG
ncbi:hypothetical protein [Streptomyces tauricus]|uniref:hypothetical protein n=1 Tax=Streptomyces tauricus TaxID=68274 RepID=UPI0033A6D025